MTAASRVRLYGGCACEDTRRSRKFLDEHGVSYEYVEVDGDPEAVARVKAWNNGNRVTSAVVVRDRLLGEPSGEKSERVKALSQAFIGAGLRAPIRRIRDEIWLKLWGNLSFNPISALTLATLDVVTTEPATREVCRRMMLEAQEIGETLGARFAVDVEKRIDGGAAVGAHKTSMLQDLERGRPMEIDALVTAVQEMGRLVEVPTPTIDAILALVQQRARQAGCYD